MRAILTTAMTIAVGYAVANAISHFYATLGAVLP